MKKSNRTRGARGARGARGTKSGAPVVSKIRRTQEQAYGSRDFWERICAQVKQRDGHKCVKCKSTKSLQVDHIIPIAQGGRTIMSNLWTLCLECHCKRPRHKRVAKLLKAGDKYRKNKGKKR